MKGLSIIIPVYNVEQYVEKCILSIINQGVENIEIIIVDDGSTDQSLSICYDMKNKYDFLNIYHKENGGLSSARNYGLGKASKDYVMFVDSDDLMPNHSTKTILNKINMENADVIIGRYSIINDNDDIIKESKYIDINKINTFSKEECIEYIFGNLKEAVWNVWRYIYNRRFLLDKELFFKEGILSEDVDFTPRVMLALDTISAINLSIYCYRKDRVNSIMNIPSAKRLNDLNDTIFLLIKKLEGFKTEAHIQAIINKLIREYIYNGPFIFDILTNNKDNLLRIYKKNFYYIISMTTEFNMVILRVFSRFLGVDKFIYFLYYSKKYIKSILRIITVN